MKSDYEKPGDFQERRSERLAIASDSTLRHNSVYNVEVIVRDVSRCGFKAECAEPVTIGSYVSLEVPGIGSVDAQVRWQVGRRMGGKFVDPISMQRCEWAAVKTEAAEDA